MNSKKLLEIKKKLNSFLKKKGVYDIILFGSFVKGKVVPNDIDVVIISENFKESIFGFHVSVLSIKDFFKPISLVNTLFREGYSLKHNKFFSEVYGFESKCIFSYSLISLTPSKKVMAVNFLRGKKEEKGLVLENNGQ